MVEATGNRHDVVLRLLEFEFNIVRHDGIMHQAAYLL